MATRVEIIEYRGIKFRRYPDSARHNDRVYFRTVKHGYLHRMIYLDAFGSIPKGYCVHHKDGNPLNNSIDNLECLSVKDHVAQHPSTERQAINRGTAYLDELRKLTLPWKRSEEGKAHFKKLALGLEKARRVPKTCRQCGIDFISNAPTQLYCSNHCAYLWRKHR